MKSRRVWAFSVVSFVLCATAAADSPEVPEGSAHSLVPSFVDSGRPTNADKTCDFLTELQRKVGHSEAEKQATRLFIAATLLANRYEEVRQTKAMQEVPVADGKRTALIKQLMEWHDSYTRSGAVFSSEELATSSGRAIAMFPPGMLGIIGAIKYSDSGNGPATSRSKTFGISLMAASSISTALVHGGRELGVEALKRSTGELPIGEAKWIKDSIDEAIDEPTKFLSESLNWMPAQQVQFQRAIRKRTVDTLVKSVQGMELKYIEIKQQESKRIPIDPNVVGSLAAIDFLEVISSEGLASPADVASLRLIQGVFKQGSQINDRLTASQAKVLLTTEKSVDDNMATIARLHNLLKQVKSELPAGSAARREASDLEDRSYQAIETLKKLCDLGIE